VLDAMGTSMHSMIDVTIVYPGGNYSFWDLCCRRLDRILVEVRTSEIEPWALAGDYQNDEAFRARFQAWMTTLWREKDERITAILAAASTSPGAS